MYVTTQLYATYAKNNIPHIGCDLSAMMVHTVNISLNIGSSYFVYTVLNKVAIILY